MILRLIVPHQHPQENEGSGGLVRVDQIMRAHFMNYGFFSLGIGTYLLDSVEREGVVGTTSRSKDKQFRYVDDGRISEARVEHI